MMNADDLDLLFFKVFKNVSDNDLTGCYVWIMWGLMMSPETYRGTSLEPIEGMICININAYTENPVPLYVIFEISEAVICKVLSEYAEIWANAKKEINKLSKEDVTSLSLWKSKDLSGKIAGNTTYGIYGNVGNVLYCKNIASAITAAARIELFEGLESLKPY